MKISQKFIRMPKTGELTGFGFHVLKIPYVKLSVKVSNETDLIDRY